MKKSATFCIAILIGLIVMVNAAWASGKMPTQVSVTINKPEALVDGRKVMMDAMPILYQQSAMVPLRFVGEVFGANFKWEPVGQRIAINYQNRKIELRVGKNEALINNTPYKLDTPPRLIRGRTVVPLRFIAEALGCQVDFVAASKTIVIRRPNQIPQASFTLNKTFAYVNEEITYLDASQDPDGDVIVDRIWYNNKRTFTTPGVYTISLKVKDARGAWSEWVYQTIEIAAVPNQKPVAQFSPSALDVYVNQSLDYFDESYDADDDEIVDWAWVNRNQSFRTPGIYQVGLRVKDRRGLWSDWYWQTINVKEEPNEPPVAQFRVVNPVVNQGETVIFLDESFDIDGDEIIEYKWTNRQRAYFRPGTVPVTLEVKDKRGKWSAPFTVEINVTNYVSMTEMDYHLYHPVPGEIINLTGFNPVNFPHVEPVFQHFDATTLLLSNSPETVKENGILYQDTVSGYVRIMYHHKNGALTRKRIYVLAENTGLETAEVTLLKRGWGGPSTDDMTVGRVGLMRYLASAMSDTREILPGQTIVLDGAGEGRDILTAHSVFGQADIFVNGNITVYFVAVDVGTDVLTALHQLPILSRDMHPRGTFTGANRIYRVEVRGRDPQRITFADNKTDPFLVGWDAITGETVINRGNYGVVYTVQIEARTRMGVLTNPRGGVFSGAAKAPDGTVYGLPSTGLIRNGSQAIMNMTLHTWESQNFIFVPPASSAMPVALLFIPY